jgi:Methyltransferase domain
MDKLRRQITDALSGIQIDFGGGSSASKGYLMAWLIRKFQIASSLDIGVYRGRSLVPQAICHREFTGGKAYGVDPWSKIEARETDNPALRSAIDRFIDAADFAAIHAEVGILIQRLDLERNCQLLRETSSSAIRHFEREGIRFGLIHIDGNHDSDRVMADISLYLPRLNGGGFVVIDDVSWDSVKPAYSAVSMRLRKVYQKQDASNDYAVFWDAPSWAAARLLNARLTFVGRG